MIKYKKIDSKTAYKLLTEDIIKEDKDFKEEKKYLNNLKELFDNVNFTSLNIVISLDNSLDEENKSYYLAKLLRDGHKVSFLSEEEIAENIKNNKLKDIDVMYINNAANWIEIIEAGIPCFQLESMSKTENGIPTVSSWNQIYKQISVIASNENTNQTLQENHNFNKMVKK